MKEKPLIAHMRIIECDVYEHLPKSLRMELDERAIKKCSWDTTSQTMYIEFGLIINEKLNRVIMSCLMKNIKDVLNNEQDAWVLNHSFVQIESEYNGLDIEQLHKATIFVRNTMPKTLSLQVVN